MPRTSRALRAAALVASGLLAGCASQHRGLVVVVPENGGRVGTVVVNPGAGETRLDSAYAAARIDGNQVERVTLGDAQVQQIFGAALAARPDRPISFTLYFLEGRDEFAPESRAVVEAIFAEIARRRSAEIFVIGHTDRVGSLDANDALSRQRANRVRADLITRGIPADRISVAGRGEREPLVATEDEVPHARNRRVEISVR